MKKLFVLLAVYICSIVQTDLIAQVNLNSGLVASFPFDGDANDASGAGYTGTVTGATLTTDRFGNANKAYSFNGTSSIVKIKNIPTFFTGDFSISLWLKNTGNGGSWSYSSFISYGDQMTDVNGNSLHAFGFAYDRTNLKFSYYDRNNGSYYFTKNADKVKNSWSHIVIKYENGIAYNFVNGELSSQRAVSGIVPVGNNILLIGAFPPDNQYFNGSIDDIKIYNRGLNNDEVTTLYTGNEIVNLDQGAVAMYPFNGNANDASGTNYNGTVTGASLTSDRFGRPNSAYYFDGNISNDDNIKFIAPYGLNNTPVSISLWAKADNDISTNSPYPVIFMFYNNTSSLAGENARTVMYSEWLGNARSIAQYGEIASVNWFKSGEKLVSFSSTKPSLFIWNNLVYTYDPSNGKTATYLNGSLLTTATASSLNNLLPFNELIIGREYSGGNNIYSDTYFKGSLDDIKIYSRVLNTKEIQTLANSYEPYPVTCQTTTVTTFITVTGLNQGVREENTDIQVYPNPTANKVSVISESGSVFAIDLLDARGTVVLTSYSITNIELGDKPKGIYFLKAKGNNGTVLKTFKIIIE